MFKKLLSIQILFSVMLSANTFTTADPPMIYIYHFVSYDSSVVILWNKDNTTPQNTETLKIPSLSEGQIQPSKDMLIVEPLDPKLVSAMVTTAVAKYSQMKIAGESIQNRINSENVLELIKSYNYPKETDYVMVGEINTLGNYFEIDLKVFDISRQDIISSKSISLSFSVLNSLRTQIDAVVDDMMFDILRPFLSTIQIYADSTSVGKVKWNTLTLRPISTMVGGKSVKTSDKDLELMVPITQADWKRVLPDFALYAGSTPSDYVTLQSSFDRKLSVLFLEGKYVFRVYLTNYNEKDFHEETINVSALRNTSFPIKLIPPPPPPKDTDGDGIPDDEDACPNVPGESNSDPKQHGCPPPPPPPMYGDLEIRNIQTDIGFEVISLSSVSVNARNNRVASGYRDDEIHHTFVSGIKGTVSEDNSSVYYEDLSLGTYLVNAWGRAEEAFPGKHYVKMFSFSDTVNIVNPGSVGSTTVPDKSVTTGREIIIYFDPFPATQDEEYRLYLDDSSSPFTVVSTVGELHIEGVSEIYSGTFKVFRDGYEPAFISMQKGKGKVYLLANLNTPAEAEKISKKKGFFLGGQ